MRSASSALEKFRHCAVPGWLRSSLKRSQWTWVGDETCSRAHASAALPREPAVPAEALEEAWPWLLWGTDRFCYLYLERLLTCRLQCRCPMAVVGHTLMAWSLHHHPKDLNHVVPLFRCSHGEIQIWYNYMQHTNASTLSLPPFPTVPLAVHTPLRAAPPCTILWSSRVSIPLCFYTRCSPIGNSLHLHPPALNLISTRMLSYLTGELCLSSCYPHQLGLSTYQESVE